MSSLITIDTVESFDMIDLNEPLYYVILLDGDYIFSLDYNMYQCSGKNIVFMTPYQLLQMKALDHKEYTRLGFHGDFYCIEFHKEEVACNGVLFNNLYDKPYIEVTDAFYQEISDLFKKIVEYCKSTTRQDKLIIENYLQLILALCSKKKLNDEHNRPIADTESGNDLNFKALLEQHYIQEHSVAFYADKHYLSVDNFSKKVKKVYGKSPTKLIKERLTLEAKKKLHLTTKPIKEIASELGFEDELYFSRYFSKEVGYPPTVYRERVGISIVAKSSMV